MSSRKALITGIAGQDGSLLAELLLDKGYEVHGIVRDLHQPSPNLDQIREAIALRSIDLLDQEAVTRALGEIRPDEVYNLASPSFVPRSWEEPVLTAEFAAVGVTVLLEAIRGVNESIRFYQASSSEIFGVPTEVPQTERTPLQPHTPYGVAKAYGHFITRSYRRRYGLHASSGILYNHESPRRSEQFLPRKVSRAVANIASGRQKDLLLGDLDARRDWGYAGDYVRATWLMLQQDEGDDFVIATGRAHSVEELVDFAFRRVGLDYRHYVRRDELLIRGRSELHDLVGDAAYARSSLGWSPTIDFEQLVGLLVDADMASVSDERAGIAHV